MSTQHGILILSANIEVAAQIDRIIRPLELPRLTATDAISATGLAVKNEPQVIIVFGNLIGGGSLKLLQRLRSCVHTALTPVLAIVDAKGPTAEEFRGAGANHVLSLPIPSQRLLEIVQDELNPRTSQEVTLAPATSTQDPDRLSLLVRTGWLDSPADTDLDALTVLASQLTHTPVALISLVDKDRQFFKSQTGLPAPWSEKRETPLTHSFCQWVVSDNGDVIIRDARTHNVLHANRAVHELGVVAYAGVPMMLDEQHCIGAFCAIDVQPKAWTKRDIAILRLLADVAQGYAAAAGAMQADSVSERLQHDGLSALQRFMPVISKGIGSASAMLQQFSELLDAAQKQILYSAISKLSVRMQDLTRSHP